MGLNNGTKAESWEISQRNGKPGIFTRNGKEWFDADKAWASQSGEYYILTGMDANANEGIAIATKASGIRIRKTESPTRPSSQFCRLLVMYLWSDATKAITSIPTTYRATTDPIHL